MKKLLMLGISVLCFALCAPMAYAQSGKLAGRVIDSTGESLPGASIVMNVHGIQRGTVTDGDGYYFLINLPPGMYDIEATMVGYTKSIQQNVTIVTDQTANIDFQLTEEALALGEMVVIAERPPVEHDKTESKQVITAEEIESLPIIRETADFVELQAGVTPDEEQSVRGGDFWETAYMVDGVRVVNNDAREGFTRFEGVNTSAVQELTVLSGGMNAEFGNAGSIVSVVTREGGQKYTGRFEYRFTPAGQKHWGANAYDSAVHLGRMRWDNPAWVSQTAWFPGRDGVLGHDNQALDSSTLRANFESYAADDVQQPIHLRQDYTGIHGQRVEAMFGGPLTRQMGFVMTSSGNRQAEAFPSPNEASLFNNRSNVKLTYRAGPNLKVNAGYIYTLRSRYNAGRIRGLEEGTRKNLNAAGRNIFVPADYSGAGKQKTKDQMLYTTLTHTISSRTFYEIRVQHSRTTETNDDIPFLTDAPYMEPGLSALESGWFYIGRPVADWTFSNRKRYQVKGDLSSQVTKGHFIKAGVDFLFYDNWGTSRNDVDQRSQILRFYSQFQHPGVGVTPRQYAFYFQDKMEFEGIVINMGMRLSRWSVNTEFADLAHFGPWLKYGFKHDGSQGDIPTYRPGSKHTFSPRIGISHPITANSAMHFTYGKFEQLEQFWWIFSNSYRRDDTDEDVNLNGRIDETERDNTLGVVDAGRWGNPLFQPLITTSFETGFDWNFVGDYTAGLTAYFKSQHKRRSGATYARQESGIQHNRQVFTSAQSVNRESRGFELSLKKRFSHMVAFTLAYNAQWVEQGVSGNGNFFDFPDAKAAKNPSAFGNWVGFMSNEGHYMANYWFEWHGDSNGDGLQNASDTGELLPLVLDGITRRNTSWEEGQRARNFWRDQDADLFNQRNWHFPLEEALYNIDGHRGTVYVRHNNQSQENRPVGLDRTNFASVTFLFATPKDFGPFFMGFHPVDDVRLNVVYRMFTGRRFFYSPPGVGGEGFYTGPVHTRTDVNFEKTFNLTQRLSFTAFLEAFNLFNQRDTYIEFRADNQLVEVGVSYVEWGVANNPLPDNPDFRRYGDVYDFRRFQDQPREFHFGLRAKF